MGKKFQRWIARSTRQPNSLADVSELILAHRRFSPLASLHYGDYGLERAMESIDRAIRENRRVALYADYDVDGTMSCVSWVWFFRAIGFENFVTYIPCRFKEGYGVNLQAVRHLIEVEKVQTIITMDTGITANEEAQFCRDRGVEFICTDHHTIQQEKMPDCIVLNPKQHPDPGYQELCGCGITFVLLRRLARQHEVPLTIWTDLLALAGMATICDVVPLNPVNHHLARLGVRALIQSERPILRRLREATRLEEGLDEQAVGFRLGPRINAVGRLGHADKVIEAFVDEKPDALVEYMGRCNDERKGIQKKIVHEATLLGAQHADDPFLFLGGDWHPGVVGIAASRVAETFWRPTWLFQRKDGIGKGSARSIAGFDVTKAMQSCGDLFLKFGGHRAAGGFSFDLKQEAAIRSALFEYVQIQREQNPDLWQSRAEYDCVLPLPLLSPDLAQEIEKWKPYGNAFEEPHFVIQGPISGVQFYKDKNTGERKHTAVFLNTQGQRQKVLFFNEVLDDFNDRQAGSFLVSVRKDSFAGRPSLTLFGMDYEV